MKLTIIVLFTCLKTSFLIAGEKDSTTNKKIHFELSFGQSLLFISNSKQIDIRNNKAVVLPTNAILFFAEFLPQRKIHIPLFLSLATESKQFLVNGVLLNERASPTLGTGITFRAFQASIYEKSKIEIEVGPLLSVLFDSNDKIKIAPIIAGRVKIMRGENFIMYMGLSYSIGINALGVLYGTGTNF